MEKKATRSSSAPPAPGFGGGAANADAGSGGPTTLQLAFAAAMLGASAGLTLYTKKTSTMLNRMERTAQNVAQRRGPPKFGPKTRAEWERSRNRWEADDC